MLSATQQPDNIGHTTFNGACDFNPALTDSRKKPNRTLSRKPQLLSELQSVGIAYKNGQTIAAVQAVHPAANVASVGRWRSLQGRRREVVHHGKASQQAGAEGLRSEPTLHSGGDASGVNRDVKRQRTCSSQDGKRGVNCKLHAFP